MVHAHPRARTHRLENDAENRRVREAAERKAAKKKLADKQKLKEAQVAKAQRGKKTMDSRMDKVEEVTSENFSRQQFLDKKKADNLVSWLGRRIKFY